MSTPNTAPLPDRMARVADVPTEVEASILVSRLEDEGIDAFQEGALASGFRAEAPGHVTVFVRAADLGRARGIVDENESSRRAVSPPAGEAGEAATRSPASFWAIVALVAALLMILGVISLRF